MTDELLTLAEMLYIGRPVCLDLDEHICDVDSCGCSATLLFADCTLCDACAFGFLVGDGLLLEVPLHELRGDERHRELRNADYTERVRALLPVTRDEYDELVLDRLIAAEVPASL